MINADGNERNWLTKVRCDNGFIWNPSICECECDKLYNIGNIEIVNIEKN